MTMLRNSVKVLFLMGLLSGLGSLCLYYMVTYFPSAKALVVRRNIIRVFENHSFMVVWGNRVPFKELPDYLANEVKKWEKATDGWTMRVGDHSRKIGLLLKKSTVVHATEVTGAIPDGSVLTIFLLEEPILQSDNTRVVPSLLLHHHGNMLYAHKAAIGTWGDLTLFPLKNYFPLPELRERIAWMSQTKRFVRFWGSTLTVGFALLGVAGMCILERRRLRDAYHRIVILPRNTMTYVRGLPKNFSDRLKSRVPAETVTHATNLTPDPQNTAPPHQNVGGERNRREWQRLQEAAIRVEIESMCHESQGDIATKLQGILQQLVGQERIRLGKAAKLLAKARKICEEGSQWSVRTAHEYPNMPRPAVNEPGHENLAMATGPSTSSDRWMYDLFEKAYPHVLSAGGDPITTTTILLCFIRPKARVSFVAGSYWSFESIRTSTLAKSAQVGLLFGIRISPETFEKNFKILEKSGVIISRSKTGHRHGKLLYSLNDNEATVPAPWNKVLRVINRARTRLLSLRA